MLCVYMYDGMTILGSFGMYDKMYVFVYVLYWEKEEC